MSWLLPQSSSHMQMNLPRTVVVTFHAVTPSHPYAGCDPLPAASHLLSQALGLQFHTNTVAQKWSGSSLSDLCSPRAQTKWSGHKLFYTILHEISAPIVACFLVAREYSRPGNFLYTCRSINNLYHTMHVWLGFRDVQALNVKENVGLVYFI